MSNQHWLIADYPFPILLFKLPGLTPYPLQRQD
jgi:hypothetical protein